MALYADGSCLPLRFWCVHGRRINVMAQSPFPVALTGLFVILYLREQNHPPLPDPPFG
jgi:hypothetical protein